MKQIIELQSIIGVTFKDEKLLRQVFIHRSYLNENKTSAPASNEKLEFLGDSVLSLITSVYLFRRYPNLDEGIFTEIKAAIVRTESLAFAASTLGLGHYLYLSHGEEKGEGRQNANILADCFEALIAAIFLDQGFDAADRFVNMHLFADRLPEIIAQNAYQSPKSQLQELMQGTHKSTPRYEVVLEEGPEHKRTFTVAVLFGEKKLAEASGRTKKEAEEAAAAIALKSMI